MSEAICWKLRLKWLNFKSDYCGQGNYENRITMQQQLILKTIKVVSDLLSSSSVMRYFMY